MPPYRNRVSASIRPGQPLPPPQRPPANRPPPRRSRKRRPSPAAKERIAVGARRWRNLVKWAIGIIGGAILVMMVIGPIPIPETFTIVEVARQYPVAAVVLIIVFVFITVIASLIPDEAKGKKQAEQVETTQTEQQPPIPRLVYSTAVSTISLALFLSLLGVVLIRPAWLCTATPLCPAPINPHNPNAVYDTNLEVFRTAYQSEFYVLAGDPRQYSLNNPPQTIGAVRIDAGAKAPVYRVALGIHSLQQGRFGLLIYQVAVVIDAIPAMPNPLEVWDGGAPRLYQSNPYKVIYVGEDVGTSLTAAYLPVPTGHVELAPGESDELDVQVSSKVVVDLQFRIQVTYRVFNESDFHTLTFPAANKSPFEVDFSNAANWHLVQLQ